MNEERNRKQVTDAERRKVAKMLREEQEACIGTFEPQGIGIQCTNLVHSIDRCVDNGEKYYLRERLAELIEPEPERTCRNVAKYAPQFICSVCDWGDIHNDDFRYCGGCGARVVDSSG